MNYSTSTEGNLFGNITDPYEKHSVATIAGSAFILILIAVVGTIGNFLILYAILSQKALKRVKSNYFVCNLALADMTVTALVLPAAAGNVIIDNGQSILPWEACRFVAFLMPFTCVVSMLNLMLIGVQRFLGISAMGQQDKSVEARMAVILVILSWVWAAMICIPMLIKDPMTEQDLLHYDIAAAMCAWNDQASPRFALSVVIVAFFIPLSVTAFCYYELFTNVKRHSRSMARKMDGTQVVIENREKKLLGTILIVLVAFLVSWGPYCLLLVLDALAVVDVSSNEYWKRPCAWIGCSNSAFNSIIYGWRNESFRKGYLDCAYKIADLITCKRFNMHRRYTYTLRHRGRQSNMNHSTTSTSKFNKTATMRTIV